GGRADGRRLPPPEHLEDPAAAAAGGRGAAAGLLLRLQLQQLQRDRAAHRGRAVPRRIRPRGHRHPHLDGLPHRLRRLRGRLRLRLGRLGVPVRPNRRPRRRPVPIHQRPRGRQLSPRKGSTMSSTTAPQHGARRRMPFHRWFAELGWRHIVGVLASAFAVFPIMFVVSPSLHERGSIAAARLLPTEGGPLEPSAVLLTGDPGAFLRWHLNTIIVCGVVATGQVFLSLLAAYAFSRLRFRGRRGGMLAVLLIMMFPAILSMIAVYTMIAGLGEAVPLLGLNTLAGYIAV